MDQNPSTSKADRKTVEKNRRNQMKSLCSNLISLVPYQTSKEGVSLPDQLEVAANYIKKLQTKVEKIKQKKKRLMEVATNDFSTGTAMSATHDGGLNNIDFRIMGSALEVVLITGLNFHYLFRQTIQMLQDEGAEIVNASFSVQEDVIFHTIHSKINGDHHSSPAEYGAARITERLRKFASDVHY